MEKQSSSIDIDATVRGYATTQEKSLTDQINELFPSEQSLNQLSTVIAAVETQIEELDDDLQELVETFASTAQQGEQALLEAKSAMLEFDERIQSVIAKTLSSDQAVYELTRDIHQLDVAKQNLTSAITTLHHLHILNVGVVSIGSWIARKDYASIARQLPAVLNVLQIFDNYKENTQIKRIADQLDEHKRVLTVQLAGDMKTAFQSGHIGESMTDMCRVAAALEGSVKENFCKWFIDQQLAEYAVLFAENEESAWVDKIEDRYKWFVRKVADFERTGLANIFPPDWEMGRRLTQHFCAMTREILGRMLSRRKDELQWKMLGHAISHTKMFEALLMKRYPFKGSYNFDKAIWQVFDQFLDIFISAQDKTLRDFVDGCAQKIKNSTDQPTRESCMHAVPLPSSADLFLLLKNVVTESSKLSSKPDALLPDIVELIRGCLRNYAATCLTAFLPAPTVSQPNAAAAALSSLGSTANFFNLMREESVPIRLNAEQQFFTCCVLATSDWCAETTAKLQEKLAQRLPTVDLTIEAEGFYNIANNAIAVLVADVETACDAALSALTKISWSTVDSVGDESPSIGAIRGHLRQSVPVIRDLLSDRRKYFAHFCLKLATQLAHKFVGAMFRCKPLSTHGAEQLLLDAHALKTFLLGLPSVETQVVTKPPVAFTNAVNQVISRAEMILKIVMHDCTNADDFVTSYRKFLPQSDVNELQKVLEMKGLRRHEQTAILTRFRVQSGLPLESSGPTGKTASEMLSSVVSAVAPERLADIKQLERLVKFSS